METSVQLERVRYWQGQLLASSDLQTQMRVVAELRRQHNRAVHSAYGVAIGLAVEDIKDKALPIGCGLAYDCRGRELIVPVSTSVPLPSPAITSPYLLVITYDALGLGTLGWQAQGAPTSSEGVALARIVPGIPDPQLDTTFRPVVARPMARPKLANGQTVPGDTAWESWDENGISIGVQSTVDTSAAGFTVTPSYFAEAIPGNPSTDFVPAWFVSIADPTPSEFTLRLFMRRITREAFDILSPRSKSAAAPSTSGKITLTPDNKFVKYDQVSRLLPTAAQGSVVTALTGVNATLDTPLDPATDTEVAFGNSPRIDTVTATPSAASDFQVVVDTPDNFVIGDVIVKLGPSFASARPTSVASLGDLGELVLSNPITGLATGDQLGIAQTSSLVVGASDPTVTVQNPAPFSLNDIVVCVDAPGSFAPAKITNIAGASNEILTLDPPVSGLLNFSIAPVQVGGTVQTIDTGASEQKVHVSQPKLFRAGDLVTKILPGGIVSEPVQVQSVHSSSSTLTLSASIPGLSNADQIAIADFRVRSTVQNIAPTGLTLTVANASLYPAGSHIVRLNDSYVPTGVASVSSSSGTTLVLSATLKDLAPGEIISLCSFPVTVTVQSIASDGFIDVSPSGLVQTGDVVALIKPGAGGGTTISLPAIAIVAATNGSSFRLAEDIPSLAPNDTLTIITVSGTVNITPGATNTKVKLEAGHRLRIGDFLANITGWREPGPVRSTSFVIDSTGNAITVNGLLDGLMANDNVGLASLIGGAGSWIWLRLKTIPDVIPGDEALLVGADRTQGQTKSMFAHVEFILAASNQVLLLMEGVPGAFSIRPEDLSASILFVRGSPLALVRNQNLYVNWLACQTPDLMPRACPEDNQPDCPCGKMMQP